MKTAVIAFKDTLSPVESGYLEGVTRVFSEKGVEVGWLVNLAFTDDLGFKRRIEEFKVSADILVVINSEKTTFNIKKIIAEAFNTELMENENARRFLDAVINQTGVDYSKDYALLPINSTLVPNIHGCFQGFMIDEEDFVLALLPDNLEEFTVMCGKYLIPYAENKFNVKAKRLTLKFIGDKYELLEVIEQARRITTKDFICNVTDNNCDITVNLVFYGDSENESGNVVRYIVSKLKDDIYAEFDTTPGERLYDLLRLKKIRVSVAESFTGGRIASAIIKNAGVSQFFNEGIVCYSNKSKIERLGVDNEDLRKNGAVSSIVAYQMCAGLLRGGECDLAIATTGIAGPKSDDTLKPVGLGYIAIGMPSGVHTYKYNFSGTREQITEQAKNVALGLAIKILKKI